MAPIENELVSNELDGSDDDMESYVDLMETVQQNGKNTITLTLKPQNKSIGMNSTKTSTIICATMAASSLPDGIDRTPVDIVVALDISGSMQGDKMDLCKRTIQELLRNLLPHDRFGLITYSDNAEIKERIQLMTEENKKKVLSTVHGLRVYGSTNISDAIGLSFQELRSVSAPNKVRSIFLLTDGHANCGITSQSKLVELTKNCWKDLAVIENEPTTEPSLPVADLEANNSTSDFTPASLICFGFGEDHNASMLTDISEATVTGSYYYVQKDSDVSAAFGDALGGLVSIVAQSVVLKLSPPSKDVEILHVHHTRALRREDDTSNTGATYTVSLGDFYAEETRDVLIEVSLASRKLGFGDSHIADSVETSTSVMEIQQLLASLSYTDTLTCTPIRSSKPVICLIDRPANSQVVSPDDDYVTKQIIRVRATNSMEEAEKFAQDGKLDEAKQQLESVKGLIAAASNGIRNDEMIQQLASDLNTSLNGFSSMRIYHTVGSKNIIRSRQGYTRQRMAAVDSTKTSAYRGTHKLAMAQHFHESVVKSENATQQDEEDTK